MIAAQIWVRPHRPAAALDLTGIEARLAGVFAPLPMIKVLHGGFCGYDRVLRGFLRRER